MEKRSSNVVNRVRTSSLVALAVASCSAAGCSRPQRVDDFFGNYGGHRVMVQRGSKGTKLVAIRCDKEDKESFGSNCYLIGSDGDANGSFENMNTEQSRNSSPYLVSRIQSPEEHPLYRYANLDSLNVIYNSVLAQNKIARGQK